MTRVPTEREVALGLIKTFGSRVDEWWWMLKSPHLQTPVTTLMHYSVSPEDVPEDTLYAVAEECQKSLFDMEQGQDIDLAHIIEQERGWPRGTVHRFVYGAPHQAAT